MMPTSRNVILIGLLLLLALSIWGNVQQGVKWTWPLEQQKVDSDYSSKRLLSRESTRGNLNDNENVNNDDELVADSSTDHVESAADSKHESIKLEKSEGDGRHEQRPIVQADSNGRITKITRYLDSYLLENACVRASGDNVFIQVFTEVEADLEPFLAKTAVSRNLRMHAKWEQRNLNEWKEQIKSSGSVHPKEDVLLFMENEQPAHCLHDFLFSAYLDHPNGRRFDSYIAKTHPGRPCNPHRNWCCFLFDRAGVIQAKRAAPFNQATRISCFERLWVLVFGLGRYAPDWSKIPPEEHVDLYEHNETRGLFSLQHLESLHEKLLFTDDSVVLRRTPAEHVKRTNILVLDRSEARRRVWANANEFVSALVLRWGELSTEKLGSVNFLGKRFGELTPLDQARLFYHADVIISPHGAQLSNLIYGQRNRTVLVELQCLKDTTDHLVEYSDQSVREWFATFPTRLGMRAFRYTFPLASCEHNIRSFNVSASKLVDELKRVKIFDETLDLSPAKIPSRS